MQPTNKNSNPSRRSHGWTDRRVHARYQSRLPLRLVYYQDRRVESASARLVNLSDGGLCFETESTLPPGTNLYIDLEPPKKGAEVVNGVAGLPKRRAFVARVKWCHHQGRVGKPARVGAVFQGR